MGLIQRSAYLDVGELGILCHIVFADGTVSPFFATRLSGYNILQIGLESGALSEEEGKAIREQIGLLRVPYTHEEVEVLVEIYNARRFGSAEETSGAGDELASRLSSVISLN